MNRAILAVIVVAFTILTYLFMHYLVGWDQKRSLMVTAIAFLAMILPEIFKGARRRDREAS